METALDELLTDGRVQYHERTPLFADWPKTHDSMVSGLAKTDKPWLPEPVSLGGEWRILGDDEGKLLTSGRLVSEYRLSNVSLTRWAKEGCPFLGGGRVTRKPLKTGSNNPEYVYSWEDIDQILKRWS